MSKIAINIHEDVFENTTDSKPNIRIATGDYGIPNGISMDDNGQLVASKGQDGKPGVGGTMNTPGNGIHGTPDEQMVVIRCNHTVSRKQLVASVEEGLLMSTIIDNILSQ